MFTKHFDKIVIPGETITCEVDGFHCVATAHYDEDTRAPADHLQAAAWERDEWHYFGVAVSVSRLGVKLTGDYDHALWGIEGNCPGDDNTYLREVANDQLREALEAAKEKIKELCAS
jgi:hypothetical protein